MVPRMQLVLLSPVPSRLKCSVVNSSTISVAQCGLSELKMKFPETGRVPDLWLFSPWLVEETLGDRLWGCLVGSTEGLISCRLSEAIVWLTMPHSYWVCLSLTSSVLQPMASYTHQGNTFRGEVTIGVHGGQGVISLWGQRFGSHELWPASPPVISSDCRTNAFLTLVPILRRMNLLSLQRIVPLNVRCEILARFPIKHNPRGGRISTLNIWLPDELIFSTGVRKGKDYLMNYKCFPWSPLKIRGLERTREGLFYILPRFPQINKHACEYVYVDHNEITKGNHFACVQFREGFLKKKKKYQSLLLPHNEPKTLMKFNEVKRLWLAVAKNSIRREGLMFRYLLMPCD